MKYAYKVVCKTNGVFTSTSSCGQFFYGLNYELNKETFPDFGKIFVFRSLYDAQQFATGSSILNILKCSIKGELKEITKVSFFLHRDMLELFWIDPNKVSLIGAPNGSFIADSVTPLEIVL